MSNDSSQSLQPPGPLRPIRALVIGAGPTAMQAHLPAMRRMSRQGRLILDTVCDIDPSRAAAARSRFGFGSSAGDALAAIAMPGIDAVYIFGSAQLHYEYGRAALLQDRHLFVEKPIAPSYGQATTLARLARERKLIAAGGLNRRFFQSLNEVRRRGGSIRWRCAEVTFHKAELGNPPAFGARTWLTANGIHALDAMLFMMGGPPQQLTTAASGVTSSEPAAFSALMQWADGAQGVFLCNNNAGSRRESYVFHAPGQTYAVSDDALTITGPSRRERLPMPMIDDGFDAEHGAFLDAIGDGGEPRHALAAIAPSLFVAELIESGFTGAVHIPSSEVSTAPRSDGARQRRILIAPSVELQPYLGRPSREFAWVTPQDVVQAAGPLTDVHAAVLGRGSAPLTPAVLERLPALRVVGIAALSLASYDPATLLARGVTLLNASHAYASSVADFAFALAVLGRRRAFTSHRLMQAGGWGVEPPRSALAATIRGAGERLRPIARALRLESAGLWTWRRARTTLDARHAALPGASRELRDATVGLIGWGANARAFSDRVLAAGARVLVYSQHATSCEIIAAGAKPALLGDVLVCDVVSLHRSLTESTRHCVKEAELARLRPGSVLINVARGALIEPNALRARLSRGDIFACLDTFDEEPLSARDPLRRIPNVFLTSHIAGGSRDTHVAAAAEVMQKVQQFLDAAVAAS
ncbi:MAG TPA: NAD(P)-dependent oxidoreductase [Steroidobacteraceae bacterium]|jgi:phosphoglycerate dehydrogenase-like enzyme/predicted dehydrogenase|nr:NAD(P)-dependent oxidoreductase [Steroidobacteraceae bacterium]